GDRGEDDRDAAGFLLQWLQCQRGADQDDVGVEAYQLFRVGTDARRVGAAPAIVDADVAAVAPAEFFKRLPERRQVRPRFRIILDERVEHADPADTVCLLRPCRERPCCRAADKADEVPPPHGAYPKAKDHGLSIAGLRAGSGPCIAVRSGSQAAPPTEPAPPAMTGSPPKQT